jgi:polar amino acid transport system substrate-binding protein
MAEEFTGLYQLHEMGLADKVTQSGVVLGLTPSRIAFSKKTIGTEFVGNFDQALDSMISDGSYKTILERYLPCKIAVQKLGCR